MTDEQLADLEAAAKAATPGPWKESLYPFFIQAGDYQLATVTSKNAGDDSAYIAAANPAAILELIQDLRQARAEREWLAEKGENICRRCGVTQSSLYCEKTDCVLEEYWKCPTKEHWLKAAKEVACRKIIST